MNTYLENTYQTELASYPTPEVRYRYHPPISNHVEIDPSWLESQQRVSASATSAFIKAEPGVGFSADMFGEGQSIGSTRMSVLDFEGERGRYGDAPDEFEFTGYGTVWSLGEQPRDVQLQGTALQYLGEGTPFLQHFRGHAFVSKGYAWSDVPDVYDVRGVIERAPTRRARYSPPSRAYKTFKELAAWLEMSDDELAKIVDVSRTTVSMSWRNGVEPHNKAKARRLYELHSVVSALRQALGPELAGWLKRGRACPLKLLEQQKYERFERRADEVIFPRSSEPRRRLDTAWEPRSADQSRQTEAKQPKPAGRARVKRLAR